MCLHETTDDREVVCGMCGKRMGRTVSGSDGRLVVGYTCDDCDVFITKMIESMMEETYGD